MKKLSSVFIFTMLYLTSMNSFAQLPGGGSSNLGGGFGQGISVGSRSNQSFNPGSVNNPSGKPSTDKERTVFWVHGLNGDIGSWSRAATASQHNVAGGFPARKLKSQTNFTYTQSASLLEASQQLGEIIEKERGIKIGLGEDPTKDFLIAHSQGGIVSRGLMHLELCLGNEAPNNMGYGGLVTFCSPHQGAVLLNNKALFADLGGEMCKSLLLGPTAEYVNDVDLKFKLFGFIPIKIPGSKFVKYAETGVSLVCNSFKDNIVPFVTNAETPNITKDYEVGAKLLKQMNDCLDGNQNLEKFPKVAYFGIEPKEHLMLRTVKYFLESSQAYEYFEANDDNTLIDLYQKNYDKFRSKYEEWSNRYNALDHLYKSQQCYTWIKYNTLPCKEIRSKRDAAKTVWQGYLEGIKFFEAMDDKYKLIIGALEFQKNIKYYCECENPTEYSKVEISDPSKCLSKKFGKNGLMLCQVVSEVTFDRIEKDSDGVVLAESASNLPGATFSPQKMDNSSHMQARNNEALKGGLTKLYDGGTDPFFRTIAK